MIIAFGPLLFPSASELRFTGIHVKKEKVDT